MASNRHRHHKSKRQHPRTNHEEFIKLKGFTSIIKYKGFHIQAIFVTAVSFHIILYIYFILLYSVYHYRTVPIKSLPITLRKYY